MRGEHLERASTATDRARLLTMARTRTSVLVLIVASLALILWDLRASDTAVRSAVSQVVTPLQRTATSMFAPFGQWASDAQQLSDPAARSAAAEPIAAQAPPGWRTATGRVVAADIGGERASVTVDVGRSSGLQVGNAVLAPGGLVGTVARVADDSANVLLVTDPQSTIGVRVMPSGEMGVASGSGMGQDLGLSILNPAAEISIGDEVVSLGSTQRAGVPPDLPVGTISSLDAAAVDSGRSAAATPVAGMTTLDTLVILTERS